METLQKMVFAADLKGNLTKKKIKKDDILVVTFPVNDENMPTQEEVDEMTSILKNTFCDLDVKVVLMPEIYKLNVFTEEYKEHMRVVLKEVGVI